MQKSNSVFMKASGLVLALAVIAGLAPYNTVLGKIAFRLYAQIDDNPHTE